MPVRHRERKDTPPPPGGGKAERLELYVPEYEIVNHHRPSYSLGDVLLKLVHNKLGAQHYQLVKLGKVFPHIGGENMGYSVEVWVKPPEPDCWGEPLVGAVIPGDKT